MPKSSFNSSATMSRVKSLLALSAGAFLFAGAGQASAEGFLGPVPLGPLSIDPILDARLRYESVSQDAAANDADAVTLRVRAGAEVKIGIFSVLAEGEGTAAIDDSYNDTIPWDGLEPFPVVADPQNIELNRLQAAVKFDGTSLTVGRQRIILDDARFVGNVGWRQNEQTFDAVRAQTKFGPVSLDATYSISQRTIFGNESPNEHFDGDIVLLNGGADLKIVKAKAFAYLIDYDTRLAFSSQTYGVRAEGAFGLSSLVKLTAKASFATQSDYGDNPVDYKAEYLMAEAGVTVFGFGLSAGYEKLGSDDGVAAFQTPLATLHAFNGWADVFLTTPANGLQDTYVKVGRKFGLPFLPGLNAQVVYHDFKSDVGSIDYGSEWDASLGFKLGPVGLLAKYADYNASALGTDTRKFWLEASVSF